MLVFILNHATDYKNILPYRPVLSVIPVASQFSEVKFRYKEFEMSKGSNSGKSTGSNSRATPPGSGGWPSTVYKGSSGTNRYNAPPSKK